MPSFMFLDLVFIVPPLIDRKKGSEKKKLCSPVQMLVRHFSKNSKLNNKRGK